MVRALVSALLLLLGCQSSSSQPAPAPAPAPTAAPTPPVPAKNLRVQPASSPDRPPTLVSTDLPRQRQGLVDDEDQDQTIYVVVMNNEEQYSIWPSGRELPLGWHEAGFSGVKGECLAWIENVWTDMRPLSLRKQMEAGQ